MMEDVSKLQPTNELQVDVFSYGLKLLIWVDNCATLYRSLWVYVHNDYLIYGFTTWPYLFNGIYVLYLRL